MEVSVDIHKDDLAILKQLLAKSGSHIDDDERRTLKNVVAIERCSVDLLPVLERVMKRGNTDRDRPFRLHEFLQRSKIQIPALPEQERSPELEARCELLRAQQSNREYRDMTRNVDTVKAKESPLSEIGREIRAMNRHLVTLFNMVFTVVGSFVFAYFGTQYLYPTGPGAFASRLGAGLITGTVVFFADLYFIIRTLDEEAYESKKKEK